MHIKIEPVDNMKMLSLLSLLSKYDLFHVSADNGNEFNATKIVSDKSGYLEFKRLFATSVYSNGYVIDIQAINENAFVCKTASTTYHISALHIKPQEIVRRKRKQWSDISDLMDTSFIGERYNKYIKELDMLVLVIDPALLGELHPAEQRQIQHIINVYLDGYSNSMQMSRTVCFQIRLNDGCNKIYAGMFDLEGQCSVTSVQIYSDRDIENMSDEFYQRSQALLKYAKLAAPKICRNSEYCA